jgi:hypothetical protein
VPVKSLGLIYLDATSQGELRCDRLTSLPKDWKNANICSGVGSRSAISEVGKFSAEFPGSGKAAWIFAALDERFPVAYQLLGESSHILVADDVRLLCKQRFWSAGANLLAG